MPIAKIMYPSCDSVEYASTFLMSLCATAISAAIVSVVQPMMAIKSLASGVRIQKMRATRYTPAATIVAAWIRALTGVGPSIASGSQTCSGNCALLPTAPKNSPTPITVSSVAEKTVPFARVTSPPCPAAPRARQMSGRVAFPRW
jgi:hypothetical protein